MSSWLIVIAVIALFSIVPIWIFNVPLESVRSLLGDLLGYSAGWHLAVTVVNAASLCVWLYVLYRYEESDTSPDERIGFFRYLARFSRRQIFILIWYGVAANAMLGWTSIDGDWMSPTLREGDSIVYSPSAYWLSTPQRGDLVLVRLRGHTTNRWLGRIVGLPGEEVKVTNGRLQIDGEAIQETYLDDEIVAGSWKPELLDRNTYAVFQDRRIPGGNLGFLIKREDIMGKIFLRYWPISGIGILPDPEFSAAAHPTNEETRDLPPTVAAQPSLQYLPAIMAAIVSTVLVVLVGREVYLRNQRVRYEREAEGLLNLGRYYADKGQHESARSAWTAAASMTSSEETLSKIRRELEFDSGLKRGSAKPKTIDPSKPIFVVPARSKEPSKSEDQLRIAVSAYEHRNYHEALDHLQQAERSKPDRATSAEIHRCYVSSITTSCAVFTR